MSEPTSTERLRALLDKRGVEWAEGVARPELTQIRIGEKVVRFHPWQPNTLKVSMFNLTPEQAIAATLVDEETYIREDVEGAFVSGYSLGCLPIGSGPQWDENRQTVDEHMAELGWMRISDADTATTGTESQDLGHVRNPSDTDATEERQHVASDDLIGLWREWEPVLFANVQDEVAQDNLNECVHALLDKAATAGAGMCHMEQTGHVKVAGVDYYDDDYECSECGAELFEGYNYCPNCGRRIVEVDE